MLELEHENVIRAMKALDAIGYRPLVPVKAIEFADARKRREWIEQKRMIVFQMRHSDPSSTRLDIFVLEPFSFIDESNGHTGMRLRVFVFRYYVMISYLSSSAVLDEPRTCWISNN